MENLLVYILKSVGILSIFFITYHFLLKNGTFFQQNRRFLLGGILAAFLLSSVEFTRVEIIENTAPAVELAEFSNKVALIPQTSTPTNWWYISGIIYLIGLGFFLLRLVIQLSSLFMLIQRQPKATEKRYTIVTSDENLQPFSFFRYIVVNPDLHSAEEFAMILEHEKTHVDQYHSLDILLANLAQSIQWFNPFAWFYKNSIVQNLEYLADREALSNAPSKKAYQKTLLKVSVTNFEPALSNQFYQSFIKNRIIMLNKVKTQRSNFWRAGLVLPLLAAFVFFFNVKTEAQMREKVQAPGVTHQSEVEISATISKHSTEKDLKKIEQVFRERGVNLEFTNLEYSDEGLLTNIAIQFRKPETNQTGNLSLSNPDGIGSTVFYSNDNEIGFREAENAQNDEANSRADKIQSSSDILKLNESDFVQKYAFDDTIAIQRDNEEMKRFSFQEGKPLIVVEGEIKSSEFDINSIDPQNIKSINVLKGENAIDKYGERAKNGVIEIDLKSEEELETTSIPSDKKTKSTTIRVGSSQFDDSDEKKSTTISVGGPDKTSSLSEDLLYVVDGKEMAKDFDPESISPEKIASINVLKGPKAVEKYGEKAKKGVIEITTKK